MPRCGFGPLPPTMQVQEGRAPAINQRTFTERLQAAGRDDMRYINIHGFRGFEGLRLAPETEEMKAIREVEERWRKASEL